MCIIATKICIAILKVRKKYRRIKFRLLIPRAKGNKIMTAETKQEVKKLQEKTNQLKLNDRIKRHQYWVEYHSKKIAYYQKKVKGLNQEPKKQ